MENTNLSILYMYSAINNYLFKKHFNHIIVFVTTFSNTNWYDIGETLVNTKYFKVQVCVYVYIYIYSKYFYCSR